MKAKELIKEISALRENIDTYLSYVQNTISENIKIDNEVPIQIRSFMNKFYTLSDKLDDYIGTFDVGNQIIELSELHLKENIFWSNPNGKLPLKNIVSAIINGRNISDLQALQFKFGKEIISQIFDRHYKGKHRYSTLIKGIIYGSD